MYRRLFPTEKNSIQGNTCYGPSKINTFYKLLATKKIWKNNMDNIVVYKYKWKCYENIKLMSTFSHRVSKEKLSEDPIY